MFSGEMTQPESGWLLGMQKTEIRALGKESQGYGVEASGLQEAASGLVKMFMVTVVDCELKSPPLWGNQRRLPDFDGLRRTRDLPS